MIAQKFSFRFPSRSSFFRHTRGEVPSCLITQSGHSRASSQVQIRSATFRPYARRPDTTPLRLGPRPSAADQSSGLPSPSYSVRSLSPSVIVNIFAHYPLHFAARIFLEFAIHERLRTGTGRLVSTESLGWTPKAIQLRVTTIYIQIED